MRVLVVATVISTSAIGLTLAAEAAAAIRAPISIPAQPLGSALRALATDRNFQIAYRSELVNDLTTSGAAGELTIDEALTQLLSGTGLTFKYLDDKTITITNASEKNRVAPHVTRTSPDTPLFRLSRSNDFPADGERENGAQTANRGRASQEGDAQASAKMAVEEIVVTGTHIRGMTQQAAPTMVFTREDIAKTGYSTIDDVFKDLPQNVSEISAYGPSISTADQISQSNVERASAVSLRGLGPGSTLVLLNGRRRPGAIQGRVVDLSAIPLSIVDRIDVVTGGRSAVYGSDAVVGVVNLVTRRDFQGAESAVLLGESSRKGGERLQLSQTFGQRQDRGGFLLAYDYKEDRLLDLADTSIPRSPSVFGEVLVRQDAIPESSTHAGYLSGHYDLSDRTSIYLDGLYSQRDTHAGNASSFPGLEITNSGEFFAETWSANVGALIDLGSSWRIDVSGLLGVSKVDSELLFSFGGPPTRSQSLEESTLSSGSVVANGPVSLLRGVPLHAAIGIEYRNEEYESRSQRLDRDVSSVFAELRIPLLSQSGDRANRNLELQVAGRYDNYSDFGSTFNPQGGIIFQPIRGLTLRGSYSRAFKAPDLYSLSSPAEAEINGVLFADPQTPGVPATVLWTAGGNAGLSAERARNWSIGFDFEPAFIPGARFTASYYDIRFTGRINNIPVTGATFGSLLSDADAGLYAGIVNRTPTAAELDAILASLALPLRNATTTPFDPATQNILDVFPNLVLFDNRLSNIAIEEVNGLDVQLTYEVATSIGDMSFGANGNYIFDHNRRITSASPPVDLLNVPGRNIDLKLRTNMGWSRGSWGAYLYLNYVDSYKEPGTVPVERIKAWTTADVTLRWNASASADTGRGLSAALSIRNLFDRDPPEYRGFSTIGYDPINADALGRNISLRVVHLW